MPEDAAPEARSVAPAPSLYGGILLCSLAVLMQEILLTRIFSFTIWYHLAYLTISTALIGFGAAGALLTAFPRLLARGAGRLAALCAAGAAVALFAGMAFLAPRPISPNTILTMPGHFFVRLLAYYAVVSGPFLLAGVAVVAPLAAYPKHVGRLYAADLLGAGLGCLAAVGALSQLDGPGGITACASVFLAAAAVYAGRGGLRRAAVALAATVALLAPWAHHAVHFVPTITKPLGMALTDSRTKILFSRWSPVNRVDLYATADGKGGWWTGRGLAPSYHGPLPRSLGIQYDAANGTNIYEYRDDTTLEMLDHHILRTPYVLLERPSVLVIGVGGGIDVLNALRRKAQHVTGVELQPITVSLLRGRLAEWTGRQFLRPEVTLVAAEGRHYIRSHPELYDLVQITAVDTFSAQSTGAYVLAESYLYTVEAFSDYLSHLHGDGLLSIIMGDIRYRDQTLPSPLATRLALVARAALEQQGVKDPRSHILIIAQRSGAAYVENLLIKKTPYSRGDLDQLRRFARANSFKLRLAPDGEGDEAISQLVHAPPTELGRRIAEAPFVVTPVTDDTPFFYNVLRWTSVLSGERIVWFFPGSLVGQLMLLMMLAQALILGTALILLPLRRATAKGSSTAAAASFLAYFTALGIGFMLVEISFVQKYVLLLGYPTYSLSVTIFSLLLFAAIGSALSHRGWSSPSRFLQVLLVVTLTLIVAEVLALPWIRLRFLASPLPLRIAVTVALQLPLGIALGMYFPTGLEMLRREAPHLVPWAWAVNGMASVVSTVLAVMLAMAIGFSGVALTAGVVYALGTFSLIAVLRRRPAEG